MRGSPHLPVELMLRAADDAIADAGLTVADIDGIVPPPGYTSSEELAANLGIDTLRFATTVHMGGASSDRRAATRGARGDERARHQRARRRRLERLLRVPARGPGIPRPRRGLDTGAVGDVVLDYYLPVRRTRGRAVLRVDRDPPQAAVRHARHRHG